MNASSSTGWHRPRAYGTTVGLYFLVISAVVVAYSTIIAAGECQDCSASVISAIMMLSLVIAGSGITLAFPILVGLLLIKRNSASYMKKLGYGVLIYLTIGGIWSYIVVTANAGEDELKRRPPTDLRFWYAVIATILVMNGVMAFILHKRYSKISLA